MELRPRKCNLDNQQTSFKIQTFIQNLNQGTRPSGPKTRLPETYENTDELIISYTRTGVIKLVQRFQISNENDDFVFMK